MTASKAIFRLNPLGSDGTSIAVTAFSMDDRHVWAGLPVVETGVTAGVFDLGVIAGGGISLCGMDGGKGW